MFKILAIVMMLHGNQLVPGAFQMGEFQTMEECDVEKASPHGMKMIRQYFEDLVTDDDDDLNVKIVKLACVQDEDPA